MQSERRSDVRLPIFFFQIFFFMRGGEGLPIFFFQNERGSLKLQQVDADHPPLVMGQAGSAGGQRSRPHSTSQVHRERVRA